MKMKFSLVVAFIFIISLVIPEDHARVVLKKFKPKRAILMETKNVNSDISSADSKHEVKEKELIDKNIPIVRNSTGIDNETISKDSPVVDQVMNSTCNSSNNASVENGVLKRNNSECLKLESVVSGRSASTTETVSSGISEMKDNKSQDLSQELNCVDCDASSNPKVPDAELIVDSFVNNDLPQKENTLQTDVLRNETKDIPISLALKQNETDTQSISDVSQLSGSGNSSKLVEKNLPATDIPIVSTSIRVNNFTNESLQIVTEALPQKEKVENSAPGVSNNGNSDSENILKNIANASIGVNNLTAESLQEVTEVLPQNVKIEKIVPIVNNNKHSETENTFKNISNASTSFGVTNLITESLQEVTEVLPQQEIIEKIDFVMISNGHSDSENIFTNETLNQTEMAVESIISTGLDILAQSEVVKNAAAVMGLFNLSDSSLTDHVVDGDPDSVISLVLPAISSSNVENPPKNTISETANEINGTDTKNEQNTAIIDSNNHSTVELSTEIAEELPLIVRKKCPASGICIFWFIARDACTNDDQCSGSKICCKVRCSKQCIEVKN